MTDVRFRPATPHAATTQGPAAPSSVKAPVPSTVLAVRDATYVAVRDATYVAPRPTTSMPGIFDHPVPKLAPGASQFYTAAGTAITHTTLATYSPETTSLPTAPADPALARYLASTDALFPLNSERTDMPALQRELEGWAANNPAKLAGALGTKGSLNAAQAVAALRHLTPAQAAQVTTTFAACNIDFLQGKPAGPPQAFDSVGVQALVAGGRGTGVCRNYAETVTTTFKALKSMQGPTSQLANTYAHQISGFGHRWNAFYTVQPDRSVVTTMTDGVFLDGGTPDVNTRGRLYAMQQWLLTQLKNNGDDQSVLVERATSSDVRTFLGLRMPGDGVVSADEVRAAGGIEKLASRFRGLWLPQQAGVLKSLAPDVRRDLLNTMRGHGDPQPFDALPTQKVALF